METLVTALTKAARRVEHSGSDSRRRIELGQRAIELINEFFFQTCEELGRCSVGDEEFLYFSRFHRYWERHYRDILNARINHRRARLAAKYLSAAVRKYGDGILALTHVTHGLTPRQIARVRFLTANQDFRQPPEDQFGRYRDDPKRFAARRVANDPEEFLKSIGATRLSQTDKRIDFARNAASFLLRHEISAFDIAERFGNDVVQIREALVEAKNMGYGLKKANMFIRDMVVLKVWPEPKNINQLDVASDTNTMKLALRTGILETEIPLVSSYLDIFCYQYGYIDEMSAKAWRVVWQQWQKVDPETAPISPCQMDFLLYRIGREYCKEMVITQICEHGHTVLRFNRLTYCPTCRVEGEKVTLGSNARVLPCQVDASDLPRDADGQLALPDDKLLKTFDGRCIFEAVCQPKDSGFQALDPPKSISIKGQTSWTSSYSYVGKGGGGMMG